MSKKQPPKKPTKTTKPTETKTLIKDDTIILKISLAGARKHVEFLDKVQDKIWQIGSIGWLLKNLDFQKIEKDPEIYYLNNQGDILEKICCNLNEDFDFFDYNILSPLKEVVEKLDGKGDEKDA